MKLLFNTKQELINWLYAKETDGYISLENSGSLDEYLNDNFTFSSREGVAWELGIEFQNLLEITGNDDDDGEWAGSEYYNLDEDKFPKEFPCIVLIQIYTIDKSTIFHTDFIYLSDFNKHTEQKQKIIPSAEDILDILIPQKDNVSKEENLDSLNQNIEVLNSWRNLNTETTKQFEAIFLSPQFTDKIIYKEAEDAYGDDDRYTPINNIDNEYIVVTKSEYDAVIEFLKKKRWENFI